MRKPPAEETEMVKGAEGEPGAGESCGWGLAQPGERLERAGVGERMRLRMRRRELRRFMVVDGEEV